MKIVVLHTANDRYAAEIVTTAMIRSFTAAQVTGADYTDVNCLPEATVLINPPDDIPWLAADIHRERRKALVLGRIGQIMADALGVALASGGLVGFADAASATVDATLEHNASAASICYTGHELARVSPLRRRPLCRFDFADEWNNLGFGRITVDRGPWAVALPVVRVWAEPLAWLTARPDGRRIAYSVLSETADSAVVWFNRPVGPVDSVEWRVVESFFGDYRADELDCFPYLAETPAGFAGAATARLDCDEAIGSARALFELYRDSKVPLSLAVLTGQTIRNGDLKFLREVIAAGGSVVSHSVNHFPNWGGDYATAMQEALNSKRWLEEHVGCAAAECYAASPFHQNPPYAVAALADAGYGGFVGGIIANDPEYLLGRAGRVPFARAPIVSYSSQCMLHGDCFRRYGGRIDAYVDSFHNHLAARATFGYLDHPFSARYQYGWDDESARLAAHRQLIEHMQREPGIWWPNVNEALGFLRKRDAARVGLDDGRLRFEPPPQDELPPLSVLWKGQEIVN